MVLLALIDEDEEQNNQTVYFYIKLNIIHYLTMCTDSFLYTYILQSGRQTINLQTENKTMV